MAQHEAPHKPDDTGTGSDETENSAAPARARFSWLTETFILRSVFHILLIASITFLAIDFTELYEQANAPLPGLQTERDPVVMEPPKRRDHVRPYLPRTMPVRRSGKGPKMPGFAKPPPNKMVGEKMTFKRGPKGAASAVGRIEVGTAAAFTEFIEGQGGEIKSLHLHSPGGSVQDALRMSKLLRTKNIETFVPSNGYCASSCPIDFTGGVKRTAGRRAWIGVHRVFTTPSTPGSVNDGMAQGQEISAPVQDHLVKMGVDTRAWTTQ